MNSFNPQLTGQVVSAIAVTAVVSIFTLILLYSGIPLFGPINDITNAIGGALIVVMAWYFHLLLREHGSGIASLFFFLVFIGSSAIIINSFLVAFRLMHWLTGGVYTAIGYGLIGIWVLFLLRKTGPQPFMTPGLIRLGTVTAWALLFCLPAAILMGFGEKLKLSLLVIIVFVSAGMGWLLFPLWCWQLGRRLALK